MERQDINTSIINYLHPYNPERIGIFGSFARIHRELSKVLGKKVDVVTESAVKNNKLKKYIYNDLIPKVQ